MKKRKHLCRKKPGKWQTHDKLLNFISDHEMLIRAMVYSVLGFPGGSEVKASACNAGDLGSIPGSGRSPGEGNGNPLQYSCLENPMGGGAWWATVHGVAKSRTRLSDFTFTSLNWVFAYSSEKKFFFVFFFLLLLYSKIWEYVWKDAATFCLFFINFLAAYYKMCCPRTHQFHFSVFSVKEEPK